MRLNAGIAQLVEHDLAKVGVEGSSPFSRSSFKEAPFAGLRFFRSSGLQPGSGMKESQASSGRVAEWLCSGLQIRVRRFNSDLGLHHSMVLKPRFGGVFLWALPCTAATRRRTGGHAASTSM